MSYSGDSQVYSRFALLFATGILGVQYFKSLDEACKYAGTYVVKIIELIFVDGRITDAVLHDVRPSTWFGKSSPAQEPDPSARVQDGASK